MQTHPKDCFGIIIKHGTIESPDVIYSLLNNSNFSISLVLALDLLVFISEELFVQRKLNIKPLKTQFVHLAPKSPH